MIVTGAVFTAISAAMAVFAVVGGNGGIKDADPGTTGWVAGACSGACLSIGVPVLSGGCASRCGNNRGKGNASVLTMIQQADHPGSWRFTYD